MRRLSALVSGSGGGISAVAFFLPWVSFSCAGEERVYSGMTLAGEDNPQVWIILVLAVLIIAIALFFWNHAIAHFLVLIASLCGLGLLIIEYLQQVQNAEVELKAWGHTLDALDIRVRGGGWASAVGFVLASLAGVLGLTTDSPSPVDQGDSGSS